MLITVLIIQIISGMVMVNVGSVQRTERLTRACEQVQIALRYARILAMSSGQQAGVEFDTSTNTFRVFQGPSFTTVSNSMIPSGTYAINLSTSPELSGVKISAATISGGSNPYRVIYGSLGGALNTPIDVEMSTERYGSAIAANITLNYGTQNMTVRVYQVGEAKIK
jgi:Tfp pilus assembly protein FimT